MNNSDINDTDALFNRIYKKKKEKEENKLKKYNKIFDKCKRKIKWAADNHQYYILFEIPKFSYNCPLYNLEECAFYIKEKLKTKFKLHHFTPNDLYHLHKSNTNIQHLSHILLISWEHINAHINKIYK